MSKATPRNARKPAEASGFKTSDEAVKAFSADIKASGSLIANIRATLERGITGRDLLEEALRKANVVAKPELIIGWRSRIRKASNGIKDGHAESKDWTITNVDGTLRVTVATPKARKAKAAVVTNGAAPDASGATDGASDAKPQADGPVTANGDAEAHVLSVAKLDAAYRAKLIAKLQAMK